MYPEAGAIDDRRRGAGEEVGGGFLLTLREETREEHAALEAATNLSEPPVTERRMISFLEKMYGFHRAWESWMVASPLIAEVGAEFIERRRKSLLLNLDLAVLGRGDPKRLPVCSSLPFSPTLENAAGALYVVEGSTLGAQLIRRWTVAEPWMPRGGLRYLDAYGARTGLMWQETRGIISEVAARGQAQDLIDAARATFRHLQSWFGEIRRSP